MKSPITWEYFEQYSGGRDYSEGGAEGYFTRADAEAIRQHCVADFQLPTGDYQIRLLEGGSSGGHALKLLRRLRLDAFGVEVFEGVVKQTPLFLRKYNFHASITEIPFPDDFFDVTITSAVCYLVSSKAVLRAFREIARVSRYLILWPLTIEWEQKHGVHDRFLTLRLTRRQWARLALRSGCWKQVPHPTENYELFKRVA